MKALIITFNGDNYVVNGPLSAEEASVLTREAYLVILLADSKTAKEDKDYNVFLECVANSPLYCRAERQIKTMEYIIGMSLSSFVKSSDFELPTKVVFDEKTT